MAQAHTIHHSFAVEGAQRQFALVLACMLALAVALAYYFPGHYDANAWTPDSVIGVAGP
jgi:hypothetical protein